MASGLITSWQTDGVTKEMGTDFIFLGSRITVDGDCSHEIIIIIILVLFFIFFHLFLLVGG